MRSILLLLFLVTAGAGATAQPPRTELDEALRDAKRAMTENGKADPERLRKSKAKWDEWTREIERVSAIQDRARAEGGTQLDRAIANYVAIADTTESALDNYLAGRLLGMVGGARLDDAKRHFDRSLAADPYFYWSLNGLATYWVNRGVYDAAIKHYRHALELNPDFVNARRGLALCLIKVGRPDEAEPHLRRVLEAHPDEIDTLATLAGVLTDRDRFLDAIAVYERIRTLQPDRPGIRYELGRAYARADQVERALQIYEEAIAHDPRDWRSCVEIAQILHRKGLNHQAADYVQKAVDRTPQENGKQREELEEKVVALRARPAQEVIDPNRKSPNEWLEQLTGAADPAKRLEAMRVVSQFPWIDEKIPKTILRALGDTKCPAVQVLALKTLGKAWPPDDFETFAKVAIFLLPRYDENVRAMAANVLGSGKHPIAVPALVRQLADASPYVFREVHRALNKLTFAYIEVLEPETMDEEARKRIGAAWNKWYRANRADYVKYEVEKRP
jgi:tetratricopeptide (TPR) repeat protein